MGQIVSNDYLAILTILLIIGGVKMARNCGCGNKKVTNLGAIPVCKKCVKQIIKDGRK